MKIDANRYNAALTVLVELIRKHQGSEPNTAALVINAALAGEGLVDALEACEQRRRDEQDAEADERQCEEIMEFTPGLPMRCSLDKGHDSLHETYADGQKKQW